MAATLQIIFRGQDETQAALSGVRDGIGSIASASDTAKEKSGGFFSSMFHNATNILSSVTLLKGMAEGVIGVASSMVSGNAEFERYQTQFGVLLGSTDAAKQRLAELADFGARTPFELPEVVKADKILQSFGLESEDAAKKFGFNATQIRTIAGDTASGTGASFEEMSLLLGKFSTGATGEAISRMAELGIASKADLENLGLEFSKSGQLLSPLPESMNVVMTLMKTKFGGMMDAQSSTFEGMASNLQDWIGQTKRQLMAPIFDVLKDKLGDVLAFLGSDTVKNAMAGFATLLASGIGNAITWLSTTALPALQQFGAWFSTVLPPVLQFVSTIKGAFDQGGIGGAFTALMTQFNGLTPQLTSWFQSAGALILQKLGEWGLALWAWVQPMIPPLLAQLGKITASLADWVNASLPGWIQELGQLAAAAINWVVAALPGLADNLGKMYNAILTWVMSSLPGWVDKFKLIAAASIQWIIDSLPDLGTNLGKFAGTLLSWIAQTAIDVVPKLVVLAGQFLAWVASDVIPKLPDVLLAIATGIYDFISEVVRAVGPKLVIMAQLFLDWVGTEVIPKLPGVMDSIKTSIGDWVTSALTWVSDQAKFIGTAIIDGVKSGITSAVGALTEAVTDTANKALDAAKEALGIASPSAVMALLVGRPMIEGIVMGIHDAFPLLDGAMADLGGRVEESLRGVQQLAHDIMKDIIDANVSTARQAVSNFDAIQRMADQAAATRKQAMVDFAAAEDALNQAEAAGDPAKIAEARKKFDDANAVFYQANQQFHAAFQAQNQARADLSVAQQQAAEIAKTNAQAGADYLAMRSRQILEMTGLEQQRAAAAAAGDYQEAARLAEKMALVKTADAAELTQYQQHANDLAATMARQAADIAKQGADSGDGFIQGVIAGIAGQTQSLSDAMIAAVDAAIQAMRAALGIHSPSLVAAQRVGLPLMQGVAAGIAGGVPLAAGAMQGAAGAIVQAGQTTNNYYSIAYETQQSSGSAAQDIRLLSLLNG